MNEFTKRLIFGLIYVLLVVFATTYNATTSFILFTIFMLFSIYEFQKMIQLKSKITYITGLLLIFSVLLLTVGIRTSYINSSLVSSKVLDSIVIAILFSTFLVELYDNKSYAVKNIGKITLTHLYIILPFLLLIKIPFQNMQNRYDNKIVLGIFILIWCSDTFAYLVGRQFGKTKLFERISPKKTIEGFAGGVLFTLIASFILSKYFTDTSLIEWLVIALLVSVFGVLGDLVESMFKRQAQVKDSSNLIPGHGGFLDRLDSIIFATPFIYIFLELSFLFKTLN